MILLFLLFLVLKAVGTIHRSPSPTGHPLSIKSTPTPAPNLAASKDSNSEASTSPNFEAALILARPAPRFAYTYDKGSRCCRT